MAENKYFLILVISVVLFSTKTNPTKEVQMHPKKIKYQDISSYHTRSLSIYYASRNVHHLFDYDIGS